MRIAHRRSAGDTPLISSQMPNYVFPSSPLKSDNFVPPNKPSNFIYETPYISGTPYDEKDVEKGSKYGDEGFS